MMRACLRWLLGVALLALAGAFVIGLAPLTAAEVIPPSGHFTTEDLLVWRIQGAPAAWLSADVRATPQLVVVGPDHQTWHRPAFTYGDYRLHPVGSDPTAPEYDLVGPIGLQARHTPRLPGAYSWSMLAPDGTHLGDGQFTVSDSHRPRGPLGLSNANRRLLAFADGTPFIPIGPNISWANAPDRVARFSGYLDHLVAVGGNHCRLWMSSWCGQIEGDAPDHWRLDQAWLLDQLLGSARAHGVHVTLVFDNAYDLVHGKAFPYGASAEERQATFIAEKLPAGYSDRLRYILARWGSDDTILAYELFNELDMAQPIRERCVPWARAAISELKHLDPDRRLRTISWSGDDFDRISDIDGLDLLQIHRYVLEWADPSATHSPQTRDGIKMLIEPMELAGSIGKPYCFGELGYQSVKDENQGNTLDRDGLLLRQQAWAGLMLGGYGSGMNWWWDTYIDADHLWDQYRGLAKAVAQIDWKDPYLMPLAPNPAGQVLVMGWVSDTQALIWPQPAGDTWYSHYLLRQPRRGLVQPIRIALTGFRASTAFTVHWQDMVSGAELSQEAVSSSADGRLLVVVMPPDLDRVAWIEAQTPPPAPPR